MRRYLLFKSSSTLCLLWWGPAAPSKPSIQKQGIEAFRLLSIYLVLLNIYVYVLQQQRDLYVCSDGSVLGSAVAGSFFSFSRVSTHPAALRLCTMASGREFSLQPALQIDTCAVSNFFLLYDTVHGCIQLVGGHNNRQPTVAHFSSDVIDKRERVGLRFEITYVHITRWEEHIGK